MGFDSTRFEGEVDEELLCPICSFILEDPVQVKRCFDLTESDIVSLRILKFLRLQTVSMLSVDCVYPNGLNFKVFVLWIELAYSPTI